MFESAAIFESLATFTPMITLWEKKLASWRVVHGYAGRMGVAGLIGLVCGVTAILFHSTLEFALHAVEQLPGGGYRALLPALGGLICGLLVYPWAPEAAGQGVDSLIDNFHNRSGKTRHRVAPIKFLASIVTIASGGSGGYEGPVSQIGGGLSASVSTIFNMPRAVRRTLMLAGTAAGLGAVFKAPLGGALTSVEMLYKEDFESEALVTSIVAAVVAFAVYTAWAGTWPAFGGVPDFAYLSLRELGAAILLGFLCAPFSRLFIGCYTGVQDGFGRLRIPRPLKPALGGLGVGILWLAYPEVSGGSLQFVGEAMQSGLSSGAWLPVLFVGILLAKIMATALTVGSGGAGGLFGPSLFMGGMLGAAWGWGIEYLWPQWLTHPGALVLVGMGAFFAGAAKAPIAGVVMVCEMTGSYNLLPALLLASMVHVVLTRGHSIYRSQVRNKFASPVHKSEMDPDVLRSVRVGDYLSSLPEASIQASSHIAALQEELSDSSQRIWPVYQDDHYVGLLDNAAVLQALVRDPGMAQHLVVSDFLLKVPLLHPLTDMHSALRLLLRHGLPQACVGERGQVLGLIGYEDLVQSYDRLVRGRARAPITR